jgi:SecD/SecF fusion protein
MKNKHLTRTIIIWAVVIWAIINIYPTIGWMMLKDDAKWETLSQKDREQTAPAPGTRQARQVKWQKEDDEWARDRHGMVSSFLKTAKRWAEFDRNRVINLGLDLQGGIHMVLRFDVKELAEEKLKSYHDSKFSDADIEKHVQDTVLAQIRRRVDEFEAKEPLIQALGANQIQIQLPGEKNTERARALIMKTAVLNFHIVSGQDEALPVFSKIKDKFPKEFTPYLIRPTLAGEPFKVSVENYDRVRRVLEKAAELKLIPDNKMMLFSQRPKPFEKQVYTLYLVDKQPLQTGEGLTSAMARPDTMNPPYWEINFSFNNAAGAHFGEVTEKNVNRPMAIVLDNVVVGAPVIRDRITVNGQISGSFETEEARDLAIALNSGSMLVPVHEEFTRIIGPTLGAESVRKGVISTLLTLAIVGGFMIAYYLWAGVVAMIGLLVNFLLIMGAMAYFGLTLTLPGIAGLILTIGMAVDANILIYERFREELRLGHALSSCVEAGFKRAASTIIDANVTTLIAGVVLMQFGTGPVQGFALTLNIGIVATVFAALVVCHAMFDFLLEHKIITDLKMHSIFKANPNIPFLKIRNWCFAFSIALTLLGFLAFLYRGDAIWGVDFRSGTNINLAIASDTPVNANAVRLALEKAGFSAPVVQETTDSAGASKNNFIVRVSDLNVHETPAAPKPADAKPEDAKAAEAKPAEVKPGEAAKPAETPAAAPAPAANPPSGSGEPEAASKPIEAGQTVAQRMQDALAPLTKDGNPSGVVIVNEQTVGPAVGAQLRWDAVKANLWSFVFMIIYLAFRYELKYGIAGVIALLHDVLVVIAYFAFFNHQMDMTVIAALLTIIGYSINDTVVVYDRIREERQLRRSSNMGFGEIIDLSINLTLSRTVLTSMTVWLAAWVLFLFGGDTIKDFALALIIGVATGTYSSIFVASTLVYVWQEFRGRNVAPTDTGRVDTGNRRRRIAPAKGKAGEASA